MFDERTRSGVIAINLGDSLSRVTHAAERYACTLSSYMTKQSHAGTITSSRPSNAFMAALGLLKSSVEGGNACTLSAYIYITRQSHAGTIASSEAQRFFYGCDGNLKSSVEGSKCGKFSLRQASEGMMLRRFLRTPNESGVEAAAAFKPIFRCQFEYA